MKTSASIGQEQLLSGSQYNCSKNVNQIVVRARVQSDDTLSIHLVRDFLIHLFDEDDKNSLCFDNIKTRSVYPLFYSPYSALVI